MTTPFARLAEALADRYRLERELGAGGMATVYLAHDLRHDRQVAIKVLKPELAAVLGAERFITEIRTTASLQHPHILPLFDSGTAEGFLYYVMPFIDGETLRDKLNRERQLGVDEAVRIAREVADALDYAHRHGVIHRDIKPENILLHDGRPMVADFGIALAVSAAAGGRMTETGLSLGTPHYMSPEQATAEKEITGRSDVYSLACVLYEMLSGQPPHLGGTAQQVVMRIIADTPRDVAELRRTVPAYVAAAVGKALEKLPADRFATAGEFAAALANAGTPFARPRVVAPGAVSMRQRVSWFAAMAIGGIAVGWLVRGVATPGTASDTAPLRLAVPMPHGVTVSTMEWHTLAISRDGGRLAYFTNRGLEIRALDDYHSVIVDAPSGRNPMFSPDGRSVGFLADDGIWTVSVEGGKPTHLSSTIAYHATWGDDGRIYAADLGPLGIRAVGADGRLGAELTHPDSSAGEEYHLSPEVLPNGKLLFTAAGPSGGWSDTRVKMVDVNATAPPQVVLEAGANARFIAPRHLAYLDARGETVVREFDPASGRLTGDPISIDSVRPTHFGAVQHLAASRTGTIAYLPGSIRNQQVLIERDLQGRPIRRVTSGGDLMWPSVTLDGATVAISDFDGREGHVWAFDRNGNPGRRLTFARTEHEGSIWSTDGTELLYTRQALGGRREVVRQSAVTPESLSVVLTLPWHTHVLGWTSDRKWALMQSFQGGRERLVAAELGTGSDPAVLVEGSFSAALSPDGSMIAFCVPEADGPRLYTATFPAMTRRTQVTAQDACWPRFGQTDRELFFIDAGSWRTVGSLWVARQAGGNRTWSTPEKLFGPIGAQYAIGGSPSRVFVVEHDSTMLAREIRVMVGWRP